MTKAEIYKFFTDKGASPYFEITDSPWIEVKGKDLRIGTMSTTMDEMIKLLNDPDRTVFIYSNQDFDDDMINFVLIIVNIPHKIIKYRQDRLEKIKKLIDGN